MRWSIEHEMSVRRTGDGPELVWIHGLGESSTSFEPVLARLPGFAHVLIDLPGYGRSAWPAEPGGLDALADHLARWLAERPSAALIGHSMGGVLASLIAERAPVRAIVDIEGNISAGDCTFSRQVVPFTADEFRAHGFAELRSRVYADGAAEPPLRGYHAAMCFASPDAFHRNALDLVALSEAEQLAPRLAALRCPALYVAGGLPHGICAASRALLDHHRVRWVSVEPSGHWVYLDQPERFAAELTRFLC
jgi:2-succinyl-6-hydroxy-2,4-cyclohexadiene-1-carboxylate synthase